MEENKTVEPKTKKAPKAKAEAPVETKAPSQDELLEKVAALEAKVAAGEEAALKRVCNAMGIEPNKVTEVESQLDVRMIRMFVNVPVNINGKIYQGHVDVPAHVAEVIDENLGKRRQRLISEAIGKNYMVQQAIDGGTRAVLVGQTSPDGDRIA